MTSDEAIGTLSNFRRYISGGGAIDRKANEAINMAIEVLKETHDKRTGFICPENRKCMCFQCDSKDCEHWTAEIPNIPTYHMNGELVKTYEYVFIDRRAALNAINVGETLEGAFRKVTELPSADVVNREVVSQIQWERDTAISQLKDLGYGLGEKIRTDGDTISRQAAIDAIETIGFDFSDSDMSAVELEEVCEAIGEVEQEWLQRIKRLPSAQPEVITCENCKYADAKPIADGRRWCDRHGAYMYYCSDAEVREDEETDIS